MSVDLIKMWHERARPNPDEAAFNVQLGCHLEEIAEMLECLRSINAEAFSDIDTAMIAVSQLANSLKQGRYEVSTGDREALLDSLADQIVTAVGVGHCAKMNIVEACRRVNSSNWSKYDTDGKPVFNEKGKIIKGPNYKAPDLGGLY
jgi:hypothetical protein